MMENKLLACPFCGSEATIRPTTSYEFIVECDLCSATLSNFETAEQAITAWNTRCTPTPEALSLNYSEAKIARNWFLAMSEQLGGHYHDDAELYYKMADFVATKPAKEGEW